MNDKNNYYDLKEKIDYKNINIIKENNKIIKENIYKDLNKKELIYNKVYDATSFSAIAKAILASRQKNQLSSFGSATTPSPTQPQTTIQSQQSSSVATPPSSSSQAQASIQAQQPTTQSQGQAYDVNNMWSPQSFAGNVYEWNRGVIVINRSGIIVKENLDGTWNHHGGATIRTLNLAGIAIKNDNADTEPFKAGVDGSNRGAVVFQSEGDIAFIYLPSTLTDAQINSLESILVPRQNFEFAFTHNGEMFDNQSLQDIMSFVGNLNLSDGIGRTA